MSAGVTIAVADVLAADRKLRGQEDVRLDILAKRVFGTERGGTVEALLAANPGLAFQGCFVAAGTVLRVPSSDRNAAPLLPSVNPWE